MDVKKIQKIIFLALLLPMLLVLAAFIFRVGQVVYLFGKTYPSMRATSIAKTYVLDNDVREDLCEKFPYLNFDNNFCVSGTAFTDSEFFRIMEQAIFADFGEDVTYVEFQEHLGIYLWGCGVTQTKSNGKEYFSCNYRFPGQTSYLTITGWFYVDGPLYKLTYPTGS